MEEALVFGGVASFCEGLLCSCGFSKFREVLTD